MRVRTLAATCAGANGRVGVRYRSTQNEAGIQHDYYYYYNNNYYNYHR